MYKLEITDQDGDVHKFEGAAKSDIALQVYKFTTDTDSGEISVKIELTEDESDGAIAE